VTRFTRSFPGPKRKKGRPLQVSFRDRKRGKKVLQKQPEGRKTRHGNAWPRGGEREEGGGGGVTRSQFADIRKKLIKRRKKHFVGTARQQQGD